MQKYYDPTLGEVRDGNCYKRVYCFIFNKLYSEINNLDYNKIVSDIKTKGKNLNISGIKVSDFYQRGLFAIIVENHIFVMKDGIIYDTRSDNYNKIIEEVYEFPNIDITDYTKYCLKDNIEPRVGGIIIFNTKSDAVRIPLRVHEESEEESLNIISKYNMVEDVGINHSEIKLCVLPTIAEAKFVSNKIKEVAIWIKNTSNLEIYQKDLDVIWKSGTADILPVVIMSKNFGNNILVEFYDFLYTAIKLPNSSTSYILTQAIGVTDKPYLVKTALSDLNQYIKYGMEVENQ